MLEHLFGSLTRVKLLQLFLNNPEERFFVRELTRVLDSQINAVRRELQNLLDIGIVKEVEIRQTEEKKTDAKKRYYQADADFIFYNELKSIIQKAQFLLEKKFAENIKKTGTIYYLALTGPMVGEKNMEVDLIIVGDIDKKRFNAMVKKFEKQIKRELNYTLLDRDEFMYRRNVADRFLYSILDGKKIVLIDTIISAPDSQIL